MRARSAFSPVRRWRSRGAVGVVLSAVLTVTILEAVPAQAAPGAPSAPFPSSATEGVSDDPVPVPAGEPLDEGAEPPLEVLDDPAFQGDPALAPAPQPEAPAVGDMADLSDPLPDDDRTEALAEAAATDQPVEIESDTTETTISWAQPDGTVQVEAAVAPVRTQVDGDWVDVDTTLHVTDDGIEPIAVTGQIMFSPGGDAPMATIGDGEEARVSLTWPEELPEPELDGDTATYRDVFRGVDLVLTATRVGFQQHLVVRSRPNAATLSALESLEFDVATDGVEVEEGDGDSLQLVDDNGEVIGGAAPPVMWDARTDPASGGPAAVRNIGLDIERGSGSQGDATMTLTPPRSFLTDPSTVYPVTIDPTQAIEAFGTTFVQSNIANTPQVGSPELPVGTYNGGAQKNRALLLFDITPAQHRIVQSATLSLFEVYSYSCSPRWVDIRDAGYFEPSVTWNTQPWINYDQIVANANVAYGYNSSCPANWVSFNLTSSLQSYADPRNGRGGLMPLAVTASETDSFGWKKFASGYPGTAVPTLGYAYDGSCDQFNGFRVCGAIRDKYYALGGPDGYLGNPTTSETPINGGAFSHFEHGSIYWSPNTGAHSVAGSVRDKWASMGWEASALGYPTSDYTPISNGTGAFNHFSGGSIYFSPNSGAHVIGGAIRDRWAALGWETSYLGYPTTDTTCGLRDGGCFSHFTGGSIYWSQTTSAHTIRGAIRDRWAAMGWENSYLGYPTTDETCGLRDGGCYNHFGNNGSIYSSSSSGTHDVLGVIRQAWGAQGWEGNWLGYPISNPIPLAGGARNDFQGGNIVYDSRSATTTVGAGTLPNPTQFQRVTQARTQLKASAPTRSGVDYNGVKFQWRPYTLNPTDGWTDIAPSTLRMPDQSAVSGVWLPVSADGATKVSVVYTWNATASVPVDGVAQVRGCFRATDANATVRCTAVTQITVDRAGLTGANATSDIGPGMVGLLTGAYAVVGRDADVYAPHGGLAVTRSFASNAPDRAGPLGAGWGLSLAVDEAGADYASLVDRIDTVLISRGDGTQMSFVRKSSAAADVNAYVPEGEDSTSGSTLTFDAGGNGVAAGYVLADIDGDKVTFRRADGGTGHLDRAVFRVDKIEAIRGKAGNTDLPPAVTSVLYTAAGNPQWLLAPTDAGAACAKPVTAQIAGCRALEFIYNSNQQLTSIRLWAYGAAAPTNDLVTGDTATASQIIELANYEYTSGRLSSVTDPRSGLTIGYTYRSDGRVETITSARLVSTPAANTAVWTLGYDSATLPRLTSATLDDQPGTGLAAQRTSVRYDVPRGGTSALPALTAAEIARWGQQVTPTDMTAVFGPDTVPDATPTDSQWRRATLFALDVNGRTVNTATFGGTVDLRDGEDQDPAWRISTTEYDAQGRGHVIRTLTAGNRDRALATDGDAAAKLDQARLLDSLNIYSTDGMDLLRAYGPTHPVVSAAGGQPVPVRARTATAYDTGNEAGHPTPGVSRHLPVRTVVDAVQIGSSLPTNTVGTEADLPAFDGQRITTLEYGDANAWKFGIPTATRVTMGGGAEIVTRQTVDELGRTVTSTLPSGDTSTTTAATTLTRYYSADNTDGDCKSAAWAGLVCKTLPGGAPSSGAALLTEWVTAYDVYGNPTRVVETGPGVIRKSDTAYDPAGRVRRSAVAATGPEAGQARPVVETTYTAAGLVAETGVLNPDGSLGGDAAEGTGRISRSYDVYGRLTSYTDGTGLTTTSSYDSAGRLASVSNEAGTRTIGYNGNGERGSLPTSIDVDGVGTFTARYDSDGTLVTEASPGGFTATTLRDASGAAVSLSYRHAASDDSSAEWLRSTAAFTGFGQVASYRLVAASGTDRTTSFGYDPLGRLTTAIDTTALDGNGLPTGPVCTRSYTFDVNSNRTALAQSASAGAPASTCPATVPASDSYGYDTADRLQPGTAGTPRAALRYDAFGRTRTLPSVDTADQGGDVAIDYYVDDLVASLTQGTRTSVFGLDAAARRTVRTDTDTTTPGVSRHTVSRYSGDDDNPDLVTETDNSVTRNIAGFGGLAAIVTDSTTAGAAVVVQLADLHGDIAATAPASATAPGDMTVTETTEYGLPRVGPAAGTTQPRYGWLGTYQRDASIPGGLVLMGVRLYAPTVGRFLTVDPMPGGSANPYDYATGDPINQNDLSGLCLEDLCVGESATVYVVGAAAVGAAGWAWAQLRGNSSYRITLPSIHLPSIFVSHAPAGTVSYIRNAYADYLMGMGKRPARNSDRPEHFNGNDWEKHSAAQSHGGREKPNYSGNANKRINQKNKKGR